MKWIARTKAHLPRATERLRPPHPTPAAHRLTRRHSTQLQRVPWAGSWTQHGGSLRHPRECSWSAARTTAGSRGPARRTRRPACPAHLRGRPRAAVRPIPRPQHLTGAASRPMRCAPCRQPSIVLQQTARAPPYGGPDTIAHLDRSALSRPRRTPPTALDTPPCHRAVRDARVSNAPPGNRAPDVNPQRRCVPGVSAPATQRPSPSWGGQRVPTAARTARRAMAQSSCSRLSSSRCSSPADSPPGCTGTEPAGGASRIVRCTAVS